MKKMKRGIHIGHDYLVPKPAAYAVVCIIALALIAGAVCLVLFLTGEGDDAGATPATAATATPVPELIIATNTPTVAPATPTPEPTPDPTPTPEPTPRSASIRFIGEISVDENVLSAAMTTNGSYSFADMFSMVSGAVSNADYTIANVEGSMGGIGSGYSGKTDYNTPETLIADLQAIGVDMITLANDHALDAGFDGLLSTITHCREFGMEYVGGAATQEESDTPKIIDINGINVSFLNYTTTLNSKERTASEDAVLYGVNLAQHCDSRVDAAAAREAGADVIVAIVSWSEDGATKIDDVQLQVAKILLESGVDVIVGYGPRNIQYVTWLDVADDEGNISSRTLCVCSVGTFLSDSSEEGMDCGTIFEFTIAEQADGSFAIEAPTSIPTYVWKYEEDGRNNYRVLACGEWLEEQPVGMSDEDYARMQEIWDTLPETITEASTEAVN